MHTIEARLSPPEWASHKSQAFFQWLLSDLEFWICKHWPDTRPLKADRLEWLNYLDSRPWLVRNCANVITTVRLLTFWVVALGLFRSTDNAERALWILGAIALIMSDGIDGELARGLGIESRYGKAMDPLADKLLVLSVAAGLSWRMLDMYGSAAIPLVVVTAITCVHEAALGITGARVGILAKKVNVVPSGSVTAGKVKFGLQGLAIVVGWLLLGPIGGVVATLLLCVSLPYSMQSRKSYLGQLYELKKVESEHEAFLDRVDL